MTLKVIKVKTDGKNVLKPWVWHHGFPTLSVVRRLGGTKRAWEAAQSGSPGLHVSLRSELHQLKQPEKGVGVVCDLQNQMKL